MLVPIRCNSCNTILADKYTDFEDYKKNNPNSKNFKEILDKLKLNRYCCRTVMLTHVDMIKNLS